MNATDVLGCTYDGAAYCEDHCPDSVVCKTEHGAIFGDSEWQCSEPVCDTCRELIEGATVIHGLAWPCEYCGAPER